MTMTNEELARQIQQGERGLILSLWEQVRRFAPQQARRWAYLGRGGVTMEDLEQAAFLALLDAPEGWKSAEGQFLTWYGLRLKSAFTAATGQRTKRDQMDPLQSRISLDAPLTDREGNPFTLEDTIPDPQAEAAMERIGVWDALYTAVEGLPAPQREELRRRYWLGQSTAEISAATGSTEQEVRKLEAAALRTLRHPRVSRSLRVYW